MSEDTTPVVLCYRLVGAIDRGSDRLTDHTLADEWYIYGSRSTMRFQAR